MVGRPQKYFTEEEKKQARREKAKKEWKCSICENMNTIANKSRHLKSQKHLDNVFVKGFEKRIIGSNIYHNRVDDEGSNELLWACKNKMNDVALKLLDLPSINKNIMNKDGETPLLWACKNKMDDVALKLLYMN